MTTPVLVDGPGNAACTVVLAHGAGAGMEHPFLAAVAAGCSGPGYQDHPRFTQAGPLSSGIRDHSGPGKRDRTRSGKQDQ